MDWKVIDSEGLDAIGTLAFDQDKQPAEEADAGDPATNTSRRCLLGRQP